jgi:hypothetical protein
MRYYQPPADTRFYAGVDRHARSLFLVILDHTGQTRYARNLPAAPQPFRKAITPFPRDASSAASAGTAGTGWPTPADRTTSPSSSDMPGA